VGWGKRLDIVQGRFVDLSIDLRDPFSRARNILETTIPKAVYGYFHGCIFLAPAGVITGRIERQLPKLEFRVRDREPRKSRGGHLYTPSGAQISISTPSIEAITFLTSIPAVNPFYVEIALDIITDSDLEARNLHWAIEQCIVQPWAGNRNICNYLGTTYTGQRQPGPHDHMAIYSDEPSRATGELNCVHIEWRYQGRKRLFKIGIEEPGDLPAFDFNQYWRSHLPLHFLDLERYGRWLSNKETGQRRQKPAIAPSQRGDCYNLDLQNGLVSYLAHSLHPNGKQRSLQQFVQTEGRGPYLEQIDMARVVGAIQTLWKPNCAVSSKAAAQRDGFSPYNHYKE
jgi:hypothetical protein